MCHSSDDAVHTDLIQNQTHKIKEIFDDTRDNYLLTTYCKNPKSTDLQVRKNLENLISDSKKKKILEKRGDRKCLKNWVIYKLLLLPFIINILWTQWKYQRAVFTTTENTNEILDQCVRALCCFWRDFKAARKILFPTEFFLRGWEAFFLWILQLTTPSSLIFTVNIFDSLYFLVSVRGKSLLE